ncbi:MAG TPA: hypothetical protein VFC19_44985 [Candidatus Limnocylindrales bacterium]|nr:hypothetical protein [Candidatus Limnocylindrales bacterium]
MSHPPKGGFRMIPTDRQPHDPHDPTDECHHIHCSSCQLDHPGKAWQWCGECGHAYHTPGQLRRAYRHSVISMLRHKPTTGVRSSWLRGNDFEPSTLWQLWQLWHALTTRTGQINFCPLCLHDF